MLTLDDSALEALTKKGAKIVVKNTPAPEKPSELLAVLGEMKQFNSRVLSLMDRPASPQNTAYIPAPNVSVSPPAVSISPSLVIERNNTRYRVTVTRRDASAQMRIQELIIEPIE